MPDIDIDFVERVEIVINYVSNKYEPKYKIFINVSK